MPFDAQTVEAIKHVASQENIEPAALLAIAEVESNGRAYAWVDGEQEPLIRWEGHYFDRLVDPSLREEARGKGFASPRAGAIKNKRGQAARYAFLQDAMLIDRDAAIQSCSWGIGQVMGSHWKALDYDSPDALMQEARSGVGGQVRLMVRFIQKNGLMPHLKTRNWAGFARRYNGPKYKKNNYDAKMASAYARHSSGRGVASSSGVLRIGAKGARVREVQVLLRRAGFSLAADGDYGPATERAVRAFQKAAKLEVDGIVGPETMRALSELRQTPDEDPGKVPVTKDPDVGKGLGGGVGGGVLLETANRTIDETLTKSGYALPDSIVITLSLISAALAIGGLAYAAYKWWQKRQTVEV